TGVTRPRTSPPQISVAGIARGRRKRGRPQAQNLPCCAGDGPLVFIRPLTIMFVMINISRDRARVGGNVMTTSQLGGLRKLEGRRVSLALVGGSRIDDCELMSAASGCRSVWIFRNGA